MTARENALRILRFDRPERIVGGLPTHDISYFGANHENWEGLGDDQPVGSWWRDIWDVGWHKEYPGVMGFPKQNPLAEPGALARYRWPDPDDERINGRIRQLAAAERDPDTFLCGSHRDTLWERAYMLVGMENMMAYFYTEPEFAREVLHRIMDFQLGIARHYLAAGVETVFCSDDLGTQRALLLSPRIIAEFLLPEYRRLFTLYREQGVIINFHSCGHIEPLIETFVALGIDCLNPVQRTANDLERIVALANGRLALQGGVNNARILEGPVAAIRQEVRETIRIAGRRGGYFCAPDQGMPFPPEHLAAFAEAVDEFGAYPLAE